METLKFTIRKMEKSDKDEVFAMMKTFYSSDAVFTDGSTEIFNSDIENCLNDNPYLDGFIFSVEDKIIGYSMIAKSFSTEFGKPCIWFEDLYLKPEFRGSGIIPKFIDYIKELNPGFIFRLEVEKENRHAIYVYKKTGFETLPYVEMIKF